MLFSITLVIVQAAWAFFLLAYVIIAPKKSDATVPMSDTMTYHFGKNFSPFNIHVFGGG